MTELTQERLKELIDYVPESGIMTRRECFFKNQIGKVAGNISKQGYMQLSVGGRTYLLHRLAWFYVYGEWPEKEIDHKDGDKLNNSISNLREVSSAQNKQNYVRARNNSESGLLGVRKNKQSGKWVARIGLAGKRKHLGSFDTKEEAYSAYISAKRVLHPFGEIAKEAV